jgi:hypothetical protein
MADLDSAAEYVTYDSPTTKLKPYSSLKLDMRTSLKNSEHVCNTV